MPHPSRARPEEHQIPPTGPARPNPRHRPPLIVSIPGKIHVTTRHDLLNETRAVETHGRSPSPHVRNPHQVRDQIREGAPPAPADREVPFPEPAAPSVRQSDLPPCPLAGQGREPRVEVDRSEHLAAFGPGAHERTWDHQSRPGGTLPGPGVRQLGQPPGTRPSPVPILPGHAPPAVPIHPSKHPHELAAKKLASQLGPVIRALAHIQSCDRHHGAPLHRHSPRGLIRTKRPNPSRSPNTNRRNGFS